MAVGPKMTREDNMGPEGSPHFGQTWAGAVAEVAAARALRATRFCCASAVRCFLSDTDTCEYFATPGCAVGSELLPIANVDVQVLEGSFDAVFVVCSEIIHS